MSSKLSVTVLKARGLADDSDVHKLYVHLVNILGEKEGIDLKTRSSLTEAAIKSSDYIVLCGSDASTLSELFKCFSVFEEEQFPMIFLYDEAGSSVEDDLNALLRFLTDKSRINVKIFKKLVYSWTYRDIIGTLDIGLRKLERDYEQSSVEPELVVR